MPVHSTRFDLDFPDEISVAELESLHAHISDTHEGGQRPYFHSYAAGLNGWMYRLIQCSDAEARLRASFLEEGGLSPPMPERFYQECDIFLIFVAGLASLESLSFALAHAAAMARPDVFAFVTDERRVTPSAVAQAYGRAWPDEPLAALLRVVRESDDWTALAKIRNILAHRAGPGRHHYLGGDRSGGTDWLGQPLTTDAAQDRGTGLS